MAGAFASVVTCVAGVPGNQGPCEDGYSQVVQDVFIIPAAEASVIQEFFQPFDPSVTAGFFMASMSITVAIWFASWAIGNVVQAFRRF